MFGHRIICAATIAFAAVTFGTQESAYAAGERSILRVSPGGIDVTNIDPHRATTVVDKALASWMFNGLVRFPPGSADPTKLEPDLAERWTASPDGKTWTFTIRKGVKFHGAWGELTAEDAAYSLMRAADPARSSFAAAYEVVDRIEVVEPYLLRVTLKRPEPHFLGLVANFQGGNIVSRKAAEELGEAFSKKPIGTGPFAFDKHVTQQHVELSAHDGYFRGRPKLDGIMMRFVGSDSARDLAFSAGELDVIYGRRYQRWVDDARKKGAMEVDIFRPGEFRALHINRTIAPLDDVRVRRAIAHAVNVDELRAFVGNDITTKGCSVVPPGYLGVNCSAGAYSFDIEKAKALLAEAGHSKGFELKVVVSNAPSQFPVMEIIQAQLAKVGIALKMTVVDHPTYHQLIRENVSGLVFYGSAVFPVAGEYLTNFYHSRSAPGRPEAVTNFSHCSAGDAEIEAARAESIEEKRLSLWKTAQEKIHADVCSVPLFDLLQVWGHAPKVTYGFDLKGSLNLAPPINETSTLISR